MMKLSHSNLSQKVLPDNVPSVNGHVRFQSADRLWDATKI